MKNGACERSYAGQWNEIVHPGNFLKMEVVWQFRERFAIKFDSKFNVQNHTTESQRDIKIDLREN